MRTAVWAMVASALVAAGCAAVGGGHRAPGESAAAAGRGGAGGSSSDGGWNADGGATPDPCPNGCSDDLSSVLDCHGEVVQICPPGLGCGPGGCVSACESAAANKSTVGCDYYAVAPDVIEPGHGACFAAFVVNTQGEAMDIAVERGGQPLEVSQFGRLVSGSGKQLSYLPLPGGQLPPGEVAVLFLARHGDKLTDCPPGVTPAYVAGDAAVHGTGLGTAFRLETSLPAVVYDIFPFDGGDGAATSATLLIPTSAWRDNYLAVSAYPASMLGGGQPTLSVVAMEADTTVTLSPVAAIVGGPGVAPAPAHVPASYHLERGQVLQLVQPTELTGSPIQADKPIGVWGGSSCINVGVSTEACDSAHQQIPPVQALGHDYLAVPHRDRFAEIPESPPWRFVGVVDGTALSYQPSTPPGAPTALQSGQVVELRSGSPFVVRSQDEQHPFYVAGYMTGCMEVSDGSDCRGDPEFVNVVPAAQNLSSYLFFTDPTYPETSLVVTRQRVEGNFADVVLDCYGTVDGWQPLGSEHQYARVDLVRGDFEPQGSCDNGRHEITSTQPFGLVVWGWGSAATGGMFGVPEVPGFYTQAVSYAYPSGASVEPINDVVIPAVPR